MSKMRMRNSSIGIDQEDPEQITLLSNNILSYNDKKGEEVFKAHTESVSQLLNRFGINDLEKGLSSKQVELQRHKYGRNGKN